MTTPTIHILCATFNGAPWLEEWLRSLASQTHRAWHLHAKDDGSSDSTVALLERFAEAHRSNVTLYPEAPIGLGAKASFAWLWHHAPRNAEYLAFADQDDVWRTDKLALSLNALRAAESRRSGPVLVHTDLEVVDEQLRPMHASFARYAGHPLRPRPFREVMVWNTATGCTMLCNRALRDAVGPIPDEAAMHDWWIAAVAAAVGRTVVLPVATVRYRQHAVNTIGARPAPHIGAFTTVFATAVASLGRVGAVRRDLEICARQTGALLQHVGPVLAPSDRNRAQLCTTLPTLPWLTRKRALVCVHWTRARGLWRNLGLVVRG